MTISSSKLILPGSLILVTGATGFIGAHCVQKLLDDGFKVKAAVRSVEKFNQLKNCFDEMFKSNLSYALVQDICNYEELVQAVKGCDGIIHLASPFTYEATDFETQLLKPAVEGTTTILKACLAEPKVKRVVITSSFAAVFDSTKGLQPGVVYTEKDFSPLTWEDGTTTKDVSLAYRASKVVSELAAWDFMKNEIPPFDMTILCPSMVFGPLVSTDLLSSVDNLNVSNNIIWSVATSKDGIPPTKAPLYIDVRDLANAEVKALSSEKASNARYILSAGDFDNQQIADILRESFPDESFKASVPVGQPGDRLTGTHYTTDCSKVRDELGLQFRPLLDSVLDLCSQLVALQK